jgi:hypothetical protein
VRVLSSPPTEWKGEASCSTCGARLELELPDLKRVTGFDQRDNYSWDYAVFACPVCKRSTQSEPLLKSIPAHLRDQLPRH